MRKWYVVGALGILALSIGLYPLRTTRRDVRAPDMDELHANVRAHDMDELRAEVAQLRADLTAEETQREHAFTELEAWIRSSERAGGPAETARASAAAANKQANPVEGPARAGALDAGEQAVKEPVNPQEFLETVFAEQSADPSWARAAEDTIEDKLRGQLPQGSTIQSVECHASICRIETLHGDSNAYEQFLADAFKDPSKRIWSGDAFSQELSQGTQGELVVVSYLAREGGSLPATSR